MGVAVATAADGRVGLGDVFSTGEGTESGHKRVSATHGRDKARMIAGTKLPEIQPSSFCVCYFNMNSPYIAFGSIFVGSTQSIRLTVSVMIL